MKRMKRVFSAQNLMSIGLVGIGLIWGLFFAVCLTVVVVGILMCIY